VTVHEPDNSGASDMETYRKQLGADAAGTSKDARGTPVLTRFRKPFMALAVILAVMSAKDWRGWMGIEPTQDASAAPRKRF
jgi:hypothetical protein